MKKRQVAFGQKLASERTQRGVSLDDLAAAIKVRKALLVALEEGRLADLPPALFVEGFVKAYARHLGLPPEPLAAEFRAISRAPQLETMAVGPATMPASGTEKRRWAGWVLGVVLLVAAGVAAFFLIQTMQNDERGAAEPVARARRQQPAPAPVKPQDQAPVATPSEGAPPAEGESPAATNAEPGSTPMPPSPEAIVPPKETQTAASAEPGATRALPPPGAEPTLPNVPTTIAQAGPAVPPPAPKGDLVFVASKACWCEAWADGQRKIYRQLGPGETVAISGRQFRVNIGNAGAVQLLFHGAPVALPKEEGRVVKDLLIPAAPGSTLP